MTRLLLLALALAAAAPASAQQPAEACRPSITLDRRTVCLATNLPGARANGSDGLVALDAVPVAVPVDPQADSLRVFPPEALSWSVAPTAVRLNRNRLVARFPHHYRIESAPPDARIVAGTDTLGRTPATLVRERPLASVELMLEGYRAQTLVLDTLAWNVASATLAPSDQAAPDLRVERWTERSSRSAWIDAAALSVAALATGTAIYYKFEANRLYRDYEDTGDPDLRPRIRTLDTRSAVALGVGQVGLGVFAVRLVLR